MSRHGPILVICAVGETYDEAELLVELLMKGMPTHFHQVSLMVYWMTLHQRQELDEYVARAKADADKHGQLLTVLVITLMRCTRDGPNEELREKWVTAYDRPYWLTDFTPDYEDPYDWHPANYVTAEMLARDVDGGVIWEPIRDKAKRLQRHSGEGEPDCYGIVRVVP
jgi:hypothetical protein